MTETGRQFRCPPPNAGMRGEIKPTDYTPIDCGLHSEYELLIMQHRNCTLTWKDATGSAHIQLVTPTDLYTRNSEAFMELHLLTIIVAPICVNWW